MSSWCFITECEDNITVGTGHISRSITFAKYIRELGHDVQFVINNNKFAEKIIKNNEFDYASKNILEPEFNTHYQVIFLDTYDKYLSNKYVELLKGHCEKLVIISDSFKDENIKADIVIYTSEYLKNIIYDVNTLVGAKYIIMNDSFIKKQKKFSKEINTMLIAFGGYDPHNVTLKIIESLATIQSELIDKKINILIGGLYPYKKILKDCLGKTSLDYSIYQNVKDITKFYQEHDCAITAGGNTFYELCALGIPCSVVSQNMRQHNACESLKYDLHANYIGLYEKLVNSDIGYKINNFVNDEKMREKNFKSCIEFYGLDAKKIIYEKIIGGVRVSN